MKVSNYAQLLKSRGYKCRERSEYQGVNEFEKEHLYNKIVCYVVKDTHGKGVSMTFTAYTGRKLPKDMVEFKEAEFDRSYLVMEAKKIFDAFEELKTKKSPKHIYF